MVLHMTPKSSAYMENMWFWTADHDIDDATQTMIDVHVARGVLIESKGPTWIHSASSEHAQLYQWQLSGAKDIYLGHIQSETPYFQAGIPASKPYPVGKLFSHDPTFDHCKTEVSPWEDECAKAWALRVVNSTAVYLNGGAFYSFFKENTDWCARTAGKEDCQARLVDIVKSESVYFYNIWTIGGREMLSPQSKRCAFCSSNCMVLVIMVSGLFHFLKFLESTDSVPPFRHGLDLVPRETMISRPGMTRRIRRQSP